MALGTQNPTEPSQEPQAHRRLPLLLLGLSVLLVAVTVLGEVTRFGDYVWLQRLLMNPVLFLVAAGACVGLALAYGRRVGRVERVALALIFGVIAWCVSLVLGWFTSVEVERVKGDEFTAVVDRGVDLIDTYHQVYVEPRNPGLLDRSHYVGCVNGDWVVLQDVTWQGNKVVLGTDAGEVTVTLDEEGRRTSVERTDGKSQSRGAPILGGCP